MQEGVVYRQSVIRCQHVVSITRTANIAGCMENPERWNNIIFVNFVTYP